MGGRFRPPLGKRLHFFEDFALGGEGNHLPGEELAAVFERGFYRVDNAAAAGNLHAHHGKAFDVVVLQDCGEFFGVIPLVQLGAAD